MSVIEPRSLDSANEELASVGVTASVSHGLIKPVSNDGAGQCERQIDPQSTPGPVCFNLKFSSGNCTQVVSLPPIASQVIQIAAYLATIDGLAAGTVALGKVTALNPKSPLPINDPFFHSQMSQKNGLT